MSDDFWMASAERPTQNLPATATTETGRRLVRYASDLALDVLLVAERGVTMRELVMAIEGEAAAMQRGSLEAVMVAMRAEQYRLQAEVTRLQRVISDMVGDFQ